MNEQEILDKAIQKAIDGGWKKDGFKGYPQVDSIRVSLFRSDSRPTIVLGANVACDYEALIFNHDFAKALWGEEDQYGLSEANAHWYRIHEGDERTYIEIYPAYEYHLREMVIADDPIKYLEENM